jgi:NADPH:quinone reductase-like Zn-dependent oxidoreductase
MSGIDRTLTAMVSSPFVGQRLVAWLARMNSGDLQALAGFVEGGQVTPVIDRTYALAETPAAIRHLEEGHTRGKLVITV